jgi:alpha-D-ribose 1-methylphosphonate 5-triphosphate synthase subunit PhnG
MIKKREVEYPMELQDVLAEGDFSLWQEMARGITERHEVKVVQNPDTCLVMMQALDSVGDTPFCLGEVLMSEAAATVNGIMGYGFALEDETARALCFAVINAALAAQVPEENDILSAIAAEKERLLEQRRREDGLVAGTKVRFAIMEG